MLGKSTDRRNSRRLGGRPTSVRPTQIRASEIARKISTRLLEAASTAAGGILRKLEFLVARSCVFPINRTSGTGIAGVSTRPACCCPTVCSVINRLCALPFRLLRGIAGRMGRWTNVCRRWLVTRTPADRPEDGDHWGAVSCGLGSHRHADPGADLIWRRSTGRPAATMSSCLRPA